MAPRSRRALCRLAPPQLTLRDSRKRMRSFCRSTASDFLAVIAGMEMDVRADIRAPDRATLDVYCDRVACAVGRLSVRVFGMEREAGLALADHLGRALQLTNILRDLDEDAGRWAGFICRARRLRDASASSRPIPQAVLDQSDARRSLQCHCRTRARPSFECARAIMAQKRRAAWCPVRAAHHGRGLSAHSQRLA